MTIWMLEKAGPKVKQWAANHAFTLIFLTIMFFITWFIDIFID